MNNQLRAMAVIMAVVICALLLNMQSRNSPGFRDFHLLNPIGFWVVIALLLGTVAMSTWYLTRIWALPPPPLLTPPPPRTRRINWRVVGVAVLVTLVIWIVWAYFAWRPIYLIHLAAFGLLMYGLFRTVTLSAYQPITLAATLGILILGSILVPQDQFAMYIALTGLLPILLALGFCFARPGSDTDRWVAAAAVMSAVFIALYSLFGRANLPLGEQIIFSLIGAGIVFVLLPSVRGYLFPRATFTLTRREWWVVGILGVVVLLGVVISFHGTDGWEAGVKTAIRWLAGSVGLIVALVVIWSIDQINKIVKIILTVIVVALLFRNFIVWVLQGIWSEILNFQAFVSTNTLVYGIGIVIFFVLGVAFASWARMMKWIWPIIFVLIFIACFGLPFDWKWPDSWRLRDAPSLELNMKGKKHLGLGRDSTTLEIVPDSLRE